MSCEHMLWLLEGPEPENFMNPNSKKVSEALREIARGRVLNDYGRYDLTTARISGIARDMIRLSEAMEKCCEALDIACELLTVPEHQQDSEWYAKEKECLEALGHYQSLLGEV